MIQRFKWAILFLISAILFSCLIVVLNGFFLYLKDVTVQIKQNEPISFSRKILFPVECRMSLNGWRAGPPDWAADQYLSISQFDAKLNDEILSATSGVDGIYELTVPRSGMVDVVIQKYQLPGDAIQTVDVQFECRSWITAALFCGAALIAALSAIGFLISAVRAFRRSSVA